MNMDKIDILYDLECLIESHCDVMVLTMVDGSKLAINANTNGVSEYDGLRWSLIHLWDDIDTSSDDHLTLFRSVNWGNVKTTIYYNQIASFEYTA